MKTIKLIAPYYDYGWGQQTLAYRFIVTGNEGNMRTEMNGSSGCSWSYQYASDGTLKKDTRVGYEYVDNLLGLMAQEGAHFTYRRSASGEITLKSIAVPEGVVFTSASGMTWTPYTLVTDRLGSVRAIVDMSSGTVVERNDYYPYGKRITTPSTAAGAYPQLATNRWLRIRWQRTARPKVQNGPVMRVQPCWFGIEGSPGACG